MFKFNLFIITLVIVISSCNKINVTEIETYQLELTSDTCYLILPNSFTPNSDGLNDIFRPLSNGVSTSNFELIIRKDNFGQKNVFSSAVPYNSWDGSSQKQGRYIATVKGEFVNGTSFEGSLYICLYEQCISAPDASRVLTESMFDPVIGQFIYASGEAYCP